MFVRCGLGSNNPRRLLALVSRRETSRASRRGTARASIEQPVIAADALRKTPAAVLAGFILALALSGPS